MDIEGIKVVCGHCLPFHVFKKDSKDYLDIFKKMKNPRHKLGEISFYG